MGFPRRHKERRSYPPEKEWKPARWGDTDVGRWNRGVNGEEGLGGGNGEHGWDVVELGAGALRKTAHLLTALADTLPDPPANAPAPITYHALDLSRPELDRVLGQMDEAYGDALNGRVACVGLHGDYNAGIKVVRNGTLSSLTSSDLGTPSTPSSVVETGSSPPCSPLSAAVVTPAMEPTNLPMGGIVDEDSLADLATTSDDDITFKEARNVPEPDQPAAPAPDINRPLHFMFLGSSLGNFERKEAAPFLKSLPLRQGDTLLLGLDGRPAKGPEGRKKLEVAYNDPSGYTRAFEEHGWDVVRQELGLPLDDGVEFVGRYNEELGRHEAYFRSKRKQTIPLSKDTVELEEGELLQIEWSYKYSLAEALDLFKEADLQVVDSWKAPNSEYRLWLLERPEVRFADKPDDNRASVSLPTWNEWQEMWKLWDHITLNMIPKEMLHQKPIDLRHICLFYLGHIPTFLDIYLSRMTDGKPTHPAYFKDIFERGIDPDVNDPTQIHSHSEVPQREEDWPSIDQIVRFRDAVRERLRDIYDKSDDGKALDRHESRSIFMGFEHEAMHAETLLYMLLQSPMTRAPTTAPQWDVLADHWAGEQTRAKKHGYAGILDVPATKVVLGHDDAEADDKGASSPANHEFGWDIEHPATAVSVGAFKAEALPVSNKEYFEWIRSIGAMPALNETSAPASWVRVDGEWHVRSLYGPVPMSVAGAWPLMASRDELSAFAASKGGRLPTEAELRALWELPTGPRPAGRTANIGFKHWHPVPPMPTIVDNAGTVLHGHNGGVWEWTRTPLAGLPGYVQSELYPGYSSDFFDNKHYVVLGGSYATVPQIAARKSFRNWYQSNYRYAWAGGRVVYDV